MMMLVGFWEVGERGRERSENSGESNDTEEKNNDRCHLQASPFPHCPCLDEFAVAVAVAVVTQLTVFRPS